MVSLDDVLLPTPEGVATTQKPKTERGWAKGMDGLPLDFDPLFDQVAAGKGDIGIDEEEANSILHFFHYENEEGEEEPQAQTSKPSSTLSERAPSPSLEYGLLHMCKRNSLPWTCRVRRSWSSVTPLALKPSLAKHLHPELLASSLTSTSLPGKMERFSSSILQKVYAYPARTVISLNVTSVLMAYQGELLEDMGNFLDSGMPNPAVWEEFCEYQTLRLQGRYPRLWARHELLSRRREDPLAESVQPDGQREGRPFGWPRRADGAVSTLRQWVEFTEGKAFNFCLPHRPRSHPSPASLQRASIALRGRGQYTCTRVSHRRSRLQTCRAEASPGAGDLSLQPF